MRPEEIAALGELAGDGARAAAGQAHQVHAGIARRVFRAVGPMSLPVRVSHDAIARGAYTAAGELGRLSLRAGAAAAGLASAGRQTGSLEDSAAGRRLLGVLNGAVGDRLEERRSALAMPMTLRVSGRAVEAEEASLRRAYPVATPRLAVFVHGLGQTEGAWMWRSALHAPYGARLQEELGYTPLYVRYNSGRPVSENGRELSDLLARVVGAWPVEVADIVLVGHSVGGLVARSACDQGALWTGRVRYVFTLGAPHGGAPLTRLAGVAGAALRRLPETRPVVAALGAGSAGIKDLAGGGRVLPILPTAEHRFISTALSAGPRAHFELLNHPEVYEQIRGALAGAAPALPAPRLALPAPAAPDGSEGPEVSGARRAPAGQRP